jgi:hypothetical protein
LHPARGSEFIQLLIELLEAQHVMIFVAFRPIKCAELAVNVADVCVINVAIDDVGHDLATASAVTFRLCQIAPRIAKRSQFFQRPTIQFQRVISGNPRALQDFFSQRISVK